MATSRFHRLSADAARLQIAFTPLSLQSQDDIRFRYRLVPFDRTWTYAGSNRVATYTNLPAGHYRFYVVAFRLDNPSSTSEAVLSFRKNPHFYATWWFLTLAVLSLCLASLGAYRWRVRSLRLRFKAVLNERSRLAREMHDTVIQGCTSISALLEAISSLERENENLREELLNFARTQVRTTIEEAREAVWNLRHKDEPRQNLSQAVALLAEQTSKEFSIPIEFRSEGQRYTVPTSIAHEILMVIREGLYNAVLHGKPSLVSIQLCYGKDDLKGNVADNGTGFELGATPSDGKPHYGIAGMRERIERLNGKIEWTSEPQHGTTVRFRLRRSALFPIGEILGI
jgi:signal transduction histidine kinase